MNVYEMYEMYDSAWNKVNENDSNVMLLCVCVFLKCL